LHGTQRIGAVWAGIGEALAGSEQQESHDLAGRPGLGPSSLREVWSGGDDTPDALRRACTEAHGPVPRATYGLTEAPTVVSIHPAGDEWRPGAGGRVLPGLAGARRPGTA
jgi:hypothetical protein